MTRRLLLRSCLAVCACGLAVTMAFASYDSGFEDLNASPDGVILTGQDGFYLPAGSVDFLVFTYTGNWLGIPQNPEGGNNFVAGMGPGGGVYARAQRDITTDPPNGLWTARYDFAGLFYDAGPSAQNVGSFSMRSSATANDFIHLFTWVDPNDPVLLNAFYLAFDAAGVQFAQPGQSPGAGWENLEVWHWYRFWTTYDLDSNMIVEVGVVDLVTGVESVAQPTGWYLEGGAGGGVGPPIAFRFFGGGGVPSNTVAFDNTSILPMAVEPLGACCFDDGTCQDLTQEECAAAGGMLWLPDTECASDPCPPVATQETTWGRMKAGYR